MNRIKQIILAGVLGGLCAGGMMAQTPNLSASLPYWQDVQVVSVNKEQPRSSFMTYADRETARTYRYERSPYYQLLNGTWRFRYVDAYKELPADCTAADADLSD